MDTIRAGLKQSSAAMSVPAKHPRLPRLLTRGPCRRHSSHHSAEHHPANNYAYTEQYFERLNLDSYRTYIANERLIRMPKPRCKGFESCCDSLWCAMVSCLEWHWTFLGLFVYRDLFFIVCTRFGVLLVYVLKDFRTLILLVTRCFLVHIELLSNITTVVLSICLYWTSNADFLSLRYSYMTK